MTGLVGVLAEAWGEVRVHRVRVVLSLVGVFLAVLALTTVTAVGAMGRQLVTEEAERIGGRPATVLVDAYPDTGELDREQASAVLDEFVERHQVRWSTTGGYGTDVVVRFPDGAQTATMTPVDPAYGVIHRVVTEEGRWFTDDDVLALAPPLVVNRAFADALGGFSAQDPRTVQLGGSTPVTAVVVGVVDDGQVDYPSGYLLHQHAERWIPDALAGSSVSVEMWVPPDDADAVVALATDELSGAVPGATVQAYRSDSAEGLAVLDLVLAYGVRGAGLFALLLGGIGVLNVGLVTVRQRIREIGVRRSFGATSTRVFTAVLLESVVATTLAGAAAVVVSVAVVTNLPLDLLAGTGLSLTDVPPFPVRAAVEGLVAAVAVGALAGLVPAVMAVRARVVDAIRY
ncbi:ABC transporter permease [Pseudokineococcus basanitobsidens]|uniref:ABC transporter permease n=1 Tax=Pseudokineococcus basanitobsidens TaxID=1926649 RepID=A0ABU8RGC5_9ACTN